MNEKMEKKAEIPTKKKINKYDILAILLGIGLLVAGVLGIVTSLTNSDDYNNVRGKVILQPQGKEFFT